ncbi:MAG: 50S ribosomal protein L23 [Desulfobacterales bacterium]
MKEFYDIIRRPLITEKTTRLKEACNQFSFEVDSRSNRIEIGAVEKISMCAPRCPDDDVKGKVKRRGRIVGKRRDWKKAIVTLMSSANGLSFLKGYNAEEWEWLGKKDKTTSPGRRFQEYASREEITREEPEKSLLKVLKKKGVAECLLHHLPSSRRRKQKALPDH